MSRHALLPISRGFDSSIGVLSGGHDHITQRNPGQGCSSWSPTKPSGPCNPLKPPDQSDAAANNCDGGVVDYWQSEMTVSASPPAQPCSEALLYQGPASLPAGPPGRGGLHGHRLPRPQRHLRTLLPQRPGPQHRGRARRIPAALPALHASYGPHAARALAHDAR